MIEGCVAKRTTHDIRVIHKIRLFSRVNSAKQSITGQRDTSLITNPQLFDVNEKFCTYNFLSL